MNLTPLLTHLAKALPLALLEPEKTVFRVRSGQTGAITRTLRRLRHDEFACFQKSKGRDDFLWSVTKYLAALDHEELIVGIGSRRGRTRSAGAALRYMHRTVGDRASVPITPQLEARLEKELTRDGAEVVLVHNHPPHLVKTLIGQALPWRPLASDADRLLAQRFLMSRIGHLLAAERPSSFKWFLVDEGRLSEFCLPPLDTLRAWWRSSVRAPNANR
jgi:hypothetical protein